MKVSSYSCSYYIGKLSIDSMVRGKVKTASLKKCLRKVSNSPVKADSADIFASLNNIKSILHKKGSNVLDKKMNLIDDIFISSININPHRLLDELQVCAIEMKFKRTYVWSKKFGLKIPDRSDIADKKIDQRGKKARFELYRRDIFGKLKSVNVKATDKKIYFESQCLKSAVGAEILRQK